MSSNENLHDPVKPMVNDYSSFLNNERVEYIWLTALKQRPCIFRLVYIDPFFPGVLLNDSP